MTMKFVTEKEKLLKPLQNMSSLLSNRSSLLILENFLLRAEKDQLLLIGTDLEIEIIIKISLSTICEIGTVTVPIKKFFDIFRYLPDQAKVTVFLKEEKVFVFFNKIKYLLSTLPVESFPKLENWIPKIEITLPQSILKKSIDCIRFSMAYQDVRYYLNGMLFEINKNKLRIVATDGYRLSTCNLFLTEDYPAYSVIVPRNSILKLMRMMINDNNLIKIGIGNNNIRVVIENYSFTSKVVEGCFPNYQFIFSKNFNSIIKINSDILKQALSRVAILSNEKFRGVRLHLSFNQLKVTANNLEQEKAEEIIDIIYSGEEIEICFNVNYILDVLNVLKSKEIQIFIKDSVSGIRIKDISDDNILYFIMPMRI